MTNRNLFPLLLATFSLVLGSACTDATVALDRAPLGKADSIGSCITASGSDSCGGQSDGNCFCDDNCEFYGDCCSDKPTICPSTFDSCADLACGDSCSVCDPNDPTCFETAVLKECQSDGSCSAGVAQCPATNFDDCSDKLCGDLCTICDPTDPNCFESQELKVCQADGVCSSQSPICQGGGAWSACEEKVCGDLCTLCDPADANCFETAVIKACNDDGVCSAAVPTC